ncbi:MAG: hypothetical protein ABI623_04635 [bacterium]
MRTSALFLGVFIVIWMFMSSVVAQPQRLSASERANQLKDSLALTSAQTSAILKILQDSDNQRKELSESSSDDRQAMRESMRTLREKTDAKIEALLSKAQKEKFQAMKERRQNFDRPRGSSRN